MHKVIKAFVVCILCINVACAHDARLKEYDKALTILDSLIKVNHTQSFAKAVYIVENTYLNNELDEAKMKFAFDKLSLIAKNWANSNHIDYNSSDSNDMLLNRAIFQVITDTIRIKTNDNIVEFLPFEYNFNDYNGKQNWSNTFVSTLLSTHKGNCHSLPYLYKIIADELGAQCWLALAPNHMYIKNHSVRDGWFNTELTSGEFPIDAWLSTTGYIPLKAIQTGIYCDTLSNQQSIGICILDLAKCYEKQTHNYTDGFIIKCCDLVLKYHSTNIQALLLKAETLKRIYQQQKKEDNSEAKNTYNEMEQLYVHIYDLGYREMPDKMYQDWLFSIKKYINKNVK